MKISEQQLVDEKDLYIVTRNLIKKNKKNMNTMEILKKKQTIKLHIIANLFLINYLKYCFTSL